MKNYFRKKEIIFLTISHMLKLKTLMKNIEKFALESSYKGVSIASVLLNKIARPLANNSTLIFYYPPPPTFFLKKKSFSENKWTDRSR